MKRRAFLPIVFVGAACSQTAPPVDAGIEDGTDGAGADAETGDVSTTPAAGSCATASPAPVSVTYSGTTCVDGTDQLTITCNSGAHPEIVVRIDGATGEVWKITESPGLAFAMYLGTSCAGSVSCGGGALDAGGDITDGPFPANRTDYFVFEAMAPTACGPYSITVVRQ